MLHEGLQRPSSKSTTIGNTTGWKHITEFPRKSFLFDGASGATIDCYRAILTTDKDDSAMVLP
jgi:hypothetical protein